MVVHLDREGCDGVLEVAGVLEKEEVHWAVDLSHVTCGPGPGGDSQ